MNYGQISTTRDKSIYIKGNRYSLIYERTAKTTERLALNFYTAFK